MLPAMVCLSVNKFLAFEGPVLLDMRIKHLMKTKQLSQATALAKLCSDHPEISSKGNFKQTYLVCLCSGSPNEKLMQEVSIFYVCFSKGESIGKRDL